MAAEATDVLMAYTPQRDNKTWTGHPGRWIAAKYHATATAALNALYEYKRLDVPKPDVDTIEDYHITQVHSLLDRAEFDKAVKMIDEAKLTSADFKVKMKNDGTPYIGFHRKEENGTCMGILMLEVSQRVKDLNEALLKACSFKKPQNIPYQPHVTLFYALESKLKEGQKAPPNVFGH